VFTTGELLSCHIPFATRPDDDTWLNFHAKFDHTRSVTYEGCKPSHARNFYSVSLKIRFLAIVRVFGHKIPNGKRGAIPLLPLISQHRSPSPVDRKRCALKRVYHG
jgi:hypothetical protein